jgi:iron complex transport system permease protein
MGSANIDFSDALSSLFSSESTKTSYIIQEIRLPRTIAALLGGASLAVSGLLMQTLFANVLAGPYILGISSGASLAVAIVMMAGGLVGSFFIPFAAMLGSMAFALLILLAARWVRQKVYLLIIGVMLASFGSAFVGIIEYFGEANQLKSFVLWSMGDFGVLTADDLDVFLTLTLLCLASTFFLIVPLNAMLLGDEGLQRAGINPKNSRFAILIVAAVLTGVVTAYCGPIAFIGLAVPNIVRFVVKSPSHHILIPLVILCGACVGMFCDLLSRLPGQEITLPVNVISSLIGAPIVVLILLRRQSQSIS